MIKYFVTAFMLVSIPAVVFAQAEKRKAAYNLNSTSIAIEGFDPVAYFTKSMAVKGKKQHAIIHEGVTYYFSSMENMELFKNSPAKYEPQYGGWCAYAMGAKAEKVEVDPETFKIIDGKLYLFYNSLFNNTLKSWNNDEIRLKTKADVNWKKVYK